MWSWGRLPCLWLCQIHWLLLENTHRWGLGIIIFLVDCCVFLFSFPYLMVTCQSNETVNFRSFKEDVCCHFSTSHWLESHAVLIYAPMGWNLAIWATRAVGAGNLSTEALVNCFQPHSQLSAVRLSSWGYPGSPSHKPFSSYWSVLPALPGARNPLDNERQQHT